MGASNKIFALVIVLAVLVGIANASSDKLQVTKLNMDSLSNALKVYKLDMGGYPCGENPLNSLITNKGNSKKWKGPYLNPKVANLNFTDGWGNKFSYKCIPTSSRFLLYSFGENGIDNKGQNDDVVYKNSLEDSN